MVLKNKNKYAFRYHYSSCSLSLLKGKQFKLNAVI
jgi:alpha-mannosidase